MNLRVHLYWHTATDDIALGTVHMDVLPPAGSLIAHKSDKLPDTCWRVQTPYVVPAQPGSMSAAHPRGEQVAMYYLFVIPAFGPFHPGDETKEGS